MDAAQMEQLFQAHRDAESWRDFDGIMPAFTEDCYLETIALGSRSVGQEAARAACVAYFTSFPDLTPDDRGVAFGERHGGMGFLERHERRRVARCSAEREILRGPDQEFGPACCVS